MKNRIIRLFSLLILFLLFSPLRSMSFSVLTHEAIIDATWEKTLLPLLKQKFPKATEADIKKAHAFIYGGSIIPDLGYLPLGKIAFSNMLHYVRTGDFINALFDGANNINEYAFALGVLCHYEADNYGHPLGTNKSVPILFPKLKNKYGNTVAYEQGHLEHKRVEFGFDVLQIAKGNYKGDAYHDFFGFQVSDTLLARAFEKTYGLELRSLFRSLPAAISIFRWSVKDFLPELTRDAWRMKKADITKLNPLATEKNYRYKSDKKKYKTEFESPKVQSYFILAFLGVLPKIGPLKSFKPKLPNDETEKFFNVSYATILTKYTEDAKKLMSKESTLKNLNLDTGKKIELGKYGLCDESYYWLLMKTKKKKFETIDDNLKQSLVAYFSSNDSSATLKKNSHKEKKIKEALNELNNLAVSKTAEKN